MPLNSQKYRHALAQLGPGPATFTTPPAVFRSWLAEMQIPNDLVEFLLSNALDANLPFPNGHGGMWTPEDIMVLNDQECALHLAGLFAIGNANNGDFIVIDLGDKGRRAGFVPHDELMTECPPGDAREIFVAVADSIDEMLVGVSGEIRRWLDGEERLPHYPADYCDAITLVGRQNKKDREFDP